jgi:hypothetical protein
VVTKKSFWRSGGYDEDYCGSYGGDGQFTRGLHDRAGLEESMIGFVHVVRYSRQDIKDASTSGEMREGAKSEGKDKQEYIRRLQRKMDKKDHTPKTPIRFRWEKLI